MFKRLFWLTTGAGFGFGSSFWVMRWARQQIDRYRPTRIAARFSADVAAALAEGRTGMREREAELRAQQSHHAELQAARRRSTRNTRRALTAAR